MLQQFNINNTPITTHKQNNTDNINQDDNALVILAKKKTRLTQTQKTVLKKGLTFVPKHLQIQALHQDIGKFMHKVKTIIYEINNKTKQPDKSLQGTHLPENNTLYHQKPNTERLVDNGALAIKRFFHRIRTEVLDENLYKQNNTTT